MKEVTLADQVMDSLAFEVEEVPQDGQISNISSSSPLNVKIKIRKKNKKQVQDGNIISIPKIDDEMYDNEKIRATSSDQTITSFNVLMDRGQFIKKRPPKQKKIMQLFKRGGCLGAQNDEDQYEYSIGTAQVAVRENELPETTESLSSDSPNKTNFALAKNYSNTEASEANKHKHTDFLGKCKPGGCLDPPFGEDKYSYLPKFIDVPVTNETKTNECDCKETLNPNDPKIKSKDKDNISYSPEVKMEKTKPACKPCDSNVSLLQLKNSNSIITFPSISLPSEALNKLQIQRRSKSYSGSRESRSYSESNQLLETYYISPKIKTIDQRQKNITDSKGFIETENINISPIISNENLFGETKYEAHVISEVGDIEKLENAEKTALRSTKMEMIPNDVINDVTQGDDPALLKQRKNYMESTRVDRPSIIDVMPDTTPLKINDIVSNLDILFNKQKVESDKEYLDIEDTIPEANLQRIYTKSLESFSLKTENSTETTTLLPHDLKVDKTDLKSITGTSDVPLNEIDQGPIETLPRSEIDDFKNKTGMEIISSLQSLNVIGVNTKIPSEEMNQPIIKMLTKSVESIVTKKTSSEIRIASTEHSFYLHEDPFIKDDALKISSPTEKQKKDTSNLDVISFTKNINDDGTMDEDSINTKFVLPKSSSIINEDLTTIKDAMGIAPPIETLSFKEVKDSTQNEDDIETVISPIGSLHDEENFKIETAVDTYLEDTDQDMTLISKSSPDKLRELIDEYPNKLEEHVEDIIKIGTNPSTEVVSYTEVKSSAVDSTSLISSKENVMNSNYSNLITADLNFQDNIDDKDKEKLESFHTITRDLIKPGQVAIEGNQAASVINTEKDSGVHIDVNSVGNIINDGNSITDSQKVNDSIKLKSGILHDDNYHKDLEVTFNDNIISRRLDTSNILSKPTDEVETPVDVEFYQSSDDVSISKENFNKISTFPSDNVSIRNKGDKTLSHSPADTSNILSKPTDEVETPVDVEFYQSSDDVLNSKENFNKISTFPSDNVYIRNKGDKTLNHSPADNYDAKEIIRLNMAFQSFQTDEDGSVIRTLNFSSLSDSKRYPNDNILQFETIIRSNDGEIKIPIDSKKDLVLQIITDQKYKDQPDGLIQNTPYFNDQIDSKHKSNVMNEGDNRERLFPSNDSALKDNASTVSKNPLDGTKSKETNLQQSLDDVYKDKLLPLHDIIKKLKSDIDELSKQQTLIKEKLYNTKRVQSNPIYTSNKKCGCIEMFFSR